MNTEALIREIAAAGTPVHRLPPPWLRMLIWLAIAVPYVAAITMWHPVMPNFAMKLGGVRFAIEEAAAFATALTAAWAAFASTVPGTDRRLLWLPLLPLAIWLAMLGAGCVENWMQLGSRGLAIRPDWNCLPSGILLGLVPLPVMVAMLRRGAPVHPHLSVALGGLAVASIANVGLRLFHVGDISIMMLFWHLGGAIVLSLIAGAIGSGILSWRQAVGRIRGRTARE